MAVVDDLGKKIDGDDTLSCSRSALYDDGMLLIFADGILDKLEDGRIGDDLLVDALDFLVPVQDGANCTLKGFGRSQLSIVDDFKEIPVGRLTDIPKDEFPEL